jgi:RimJ/RimL family protein N-acetyltransferase
MPGPVFVEGEDVTLRPVEPEDFEFIQRNRNHPEIRAGRSIFTPTVRAEVERRHEQQISEDSDTVLLLVCVDDEPVGTVAMVREHPNDQVYRRGELAYWIAPEQWGNGYATAGSRLLLDYAFDRLNLNKVVARAFDFNEGSRRVIEKLGFTEEGRLRREAFIDGEYVDVYRYGLLESEWGDD